MSTSVVKGHDPLAVGVSFDSTTMRVQLVDGRQISVPLAWFPKLLHATPAQRKKWRFIGKGIGIHWSAIDEDLSVPALLSR